MKHGDFTALAEKYASYRPGYAPLIAEVFVRLSGEAQPRCVDAGAGTGIWSRQLAAAGARVDAVEPNDAMREAGQQQNGPWAIRWHAGSAEASGLEDGVFDLACMASSFHWPDFDAAVREFHRLLKPGGYFMALWNTRYYESNPLLVEIIGAIMGPDVTLVSAGEESAFELKRALKAADQLAASDRAGAMAFYVSDRPEDFESMASVFLQEDLHHVARRVDIDQYGYGT